VLNITQFLEQHAYVTALIKFISSKLLVSGEENILHINGMEGVESNELEEV
jgi:hypothetical protein